MNETSWIVGGGVLVVLVAALLYVYSGDTTVTESPRVVPLTIDAEPAASTDQYSTTTTSVPATKEDNTKPTMSPQTTSTGGTSAILHTSMGDITVTFAPTDAPKTVENFLKLARSGFYDGVKFHRVIKGFMDQTGDPLSKDDSMVARWGTGDPGYKFADEINSGSALYKKGYKHGVVAMANSGPNTNGSQFFIMAADYPLPPAYTIFGEVTAGLDVVDAINGVPTDANDRPLTHVVIKSVEVK